MTESIVKLNNTEINPCLVCFCFNPCLLKKVFFGCEVLKLLMRQDRELRKFCESTIAKKIMLGSTVPKEALCSKNSAVGIGLIKPKTAVATLAYKLHIGNVRVKIKIGKIIRYQEEAVEIKHRRDWKGKEE